MEKVLKQIENGKFDHEPIPQKKKAFILLSKKKNDEVKRKQQ